MQTRIGVGKGKKKKELAKTPTHLLTATSALGQRSTIEAMQSECSPTIALAFEIQEVGGQDCNSNSRGISLEIDDNKVL